jgi:hypothetical protein
MENQIVKIEPIELENVVNGSGLEIQQGEEIKQSYLPFLIQLAEIQEQSSKINFSKPTEIDETIARELRLKTVKIRTGSSDLKDSRKRIHLLKGNLEQAAYNLIAASCKLAEETFTNVEKAREIAEKKRKEEVRINRLNLLSTDYPEFNPQFTDLTNMPDESLIQLINGLKSAKEQKIADEKKVEADRIAKEKAEKEEQERIRVENEKLKLEAIEREKKAEVERVKQAKILADQKAESDKKQKAIEDAAMIEREKAEAENRKLAAELKAKKDAELKEIARIEKEKKDTELAQKKAEKAPDKQKLSLWIEDLSLPLISLKSTESKEIETLIREKFTAFKVWAKTNIDNL